MAQTSSFARSMQTVLQELSQLDPQVLGRSVRSMTGSLAKNGSRKSRLLVLGGGLVLLWWNPRLVLATAAGVATMLTVYALRDFAWARTQTRLNTWLVGWNQTFVWASVSGAGVTFFIYLAMSLWLETDQHWLATAFIVQTLCGLGTLGWLVWQQQRSTLTESLAGVQAALAQLSDADPLRRLLAVQFLHNAVGAGQLSASQQQQLVPCLRLMATQESTPIVRDAVLDALQQLSDRGAILSLAASPGVPLSKAQVSQVQLPKVQAIEQPPVVLPPDRILEPHALEI